MITQDMSAMRLPGILCRCFAVVGLLTSNCLGQESGSLSPPVFLPDGGEFKTWEGTPRFTRAYYVDGKNPGASDSNPGTLEKPFSTISRAAQVLQSGERVVIASGIYRERIIPARGGNGPDQMISYEASPGALVVVKGSQVFEEKWTRAGDGLPAQVWKARLNEKYFSGYNPFNIDNVTPAQFDAMSWAETLRGKPPCNAHVSRGPTRAARQSSW
jgi:hypothetical protein